MADTDDSAPETEHLDDDLNTAAERIVGLMGDGDDLPPSEQKAEDEPEAPALDGDEAPKVEQKSEPAEEPEFEVTVDGQKLKVKQSDLLAGYQTQQAATKRFTEAAELKKQAEATAQSARTEYQQGLQTIMQRVEQAVQSGNLAPPDPTLLDSNPVEYLKQQQRWEQARAAYQDAQARDQQIKRQQAEEARVQHAQHLATEGEQLVAKLPHWKDGTKRDAENRELTEYLVKAGYAPEQVKATADHKAVLLGWKAMQYDKLIAEQKQVVKAKVPPPQPKTAKPGVSSDEPRNPINRSAVDRLRKSGSMDDATAAIASLM